MQIVLLDASPGPEPSLQQAPDGLAAQLLELPTLLSDAGHEVDVLRLRELGIRRCTGCFGCWLKTPGSCPARDGSEALRTAIIHADLLLIATPLVMGFLPAGLKHAIDKLLPLLMPYIELVGGECHHVRRYPRPYPDWALVVEPGPQDEKEDLEILRSVVERAALNLKARLVLLATTSLSPEEIVHALDRHQRIAPGPAEQHGDAAGAAARGHGAGAGERARAPAPGAPL